MKQINPHIDNVYDRSFSPSEQLPRRFSVTFRELSNSQRGQVRVTINDDCQLGDIIDDNCYEDDFYRYHDVFHYTFAALLGWSPCARAMMKRKRKSVPDIDRVEDGARAAITEEAISLIIFNEAKKKRYFSGNAKISRTTLKMVKEITNTFEVKNRSVQDWEHAIGTAYEIFRSLVKNKGGKVDFDMVNKAVKYSMPNNQEYY